MLFVSPQKPFLFSRYIRFCLDFFVMQQNGLIKKIRLISKFKTSQPGQQTIVIHALCNISRRNDNQTTKFGHLIECNMTNIFIKKSYTKYNAETSPTSFSEKLKLSISLDQLSKVVFLLYAKLRAIETLKLSCGPIPHIILL